MTFSEAAALYEDLRKVARAKGVVVWAARQPVRPSRVVSVELP